ncbi:MAG: phosphoglycerate kinase, partial [Chloroflexi bacterium]|nr:phosphoglycerate kinase [Chloroflexota bacterium]
MPKKTVRDVPVSGERVLLRADFNVPMEKGVISSDSRIRSTLPTIRYLTQQHARLILCSHLGRPGGKVAEDLRLEPVAKRLAELLHKPVAFVRGCVGPEVAEAVGRLHPGDVLVLENLRFYPGEEKNDPDFARAMASAADLFVQDAFGVVHRAHASTVAITQFLPAVAGFLLERELEMLGRV